MKLKFELLILKNVQVPYNVLKKGDRYSVVMDTNDKKVLNLSFNGTEEDRKWRSALEMISHGYLGSRGHGEMELFKFPEECVILSVSEYGSNL